jgi:hypothetical protein
MELYVFPKRSDPWRNIMNSHMNKAAKRIIICCDGSWDNHKAPTNVDKIARAVNALSDDGVHQVVFHNKSPKRYNRLNNWLGTTFGKGIRQNMLDAYRFIALNYQADDELYIFGASRGAYTARALAGMLHTVGLLPKDELHNVDKAYKYYKSSPNKRKSMPYTHCNKPHITALAVWDTVGSVGVATPLLRRLSKTFTSFHDLNLSPDIKNAYQALAIDEKREPYQVGLWSGNINSDQTVEQVWFCGVHCDVTGGYTRSGLADITLLWMIQKVNQLGLSFDQEYLADTRKINADIMDELHDSYSVHYRWLEKLGMPDGIRRLQGNNINDAINESVHETVLERTKRMEGYQANNFVNSLSVSQPDERRHLPRMNTEKLRGAILTDTQTSSCEILDYSPLGGVRVQCDSELDKLDSITISSPRFAQTLATCAWKKDNIYGLHFAA